LIRISPTLKGSVLWPECSSFSKILFDWVTTPNDGILIFHWHGKWQVRFGRFWFSLTYFARELDFGLGFWLNRFLGFWYSVWKLKMVGKSKEKKGGRRGRACVVVLGDIGRSPRMQYHALSLANQVFLVFPFFQFRVVIEFSWIWFDYLFFSILFCFVLFPNSCKYFSVSCKFART